MTRGKFTRMITAAFLVAVLTGSWQVASAYTPGACRQDGEKLCPGVPEQELIPCLKKHQTELSMPCQVNLAEAREMVRQGLDACKSDIEKHCAGVQTGEGRIRKCLKTHEAHLTPGCKDQIAATRKKYHLDASTSTVTPPVTSTGTLPHP